MKDYLINIVKLSEVESDLSFILSTMTATPLGLFTGGLIIQKIGGYENYRSTMYCIICTLLCTTFGLMTGVFGERYIPTLCFIWMYLFIGSSIVPSLLGVVVSSVELNLKGTANSLCLCITNILGYTPAPITYTIIHEITKEDYPTLALSATMSYCIVGTILQIFCLRYRRKIENQDKLINIT